MWEKRPLDLDLISHSDLSTNYRLWVSCFFLDESFELSGMKKLWTRTLNLTRGCPPTDKSNQSPWVFLTVQGFLSENIRTQAFQNLLKVNSQKRQTNLATRGPPESPWQGPWPLLMSPAHSLSMENRWISQLNCFDEKKLFHLAIWKCEYVLHCWEVVVKHIPGASVIWWYSLENAAKKDTCSYVGGYFKM